MLESPTVDSTLTFDLKVIAVKLPEFWADNARVWFAQMEAQFAVRGVTSSLTKFYYCVGALNCADAAQVLISSSFLLMRIPMSPSRNASWNSTS